MLCLLVIKLKNSWNLKHGKDRDEWPLQTWENAIKIHVQIIINQWDGLGFTILLRDTPWSIMWRPIVLTG